MHLQRLQAGNEQHLQMADAILRTHPAFKRGQLYSLEDARALLAPPSDGGHQPLVFAAMDHGNPIAIAKVVPHAPEPHIASIDLLMVRADLAGRGLGSQMLEQLSKQARQWNGVTQWQLFVVNHHPKALSFWRQEGFTTLLADLALPGRPERVTVMERPLRKPRHRIETSASRQQSLGNALFARLPS